MRPDFSYRVDNNAADKKRFIRRMFDAIVPTYDLLNRMLSLGIDRSWRGFLIKRAGDISGRPVLDLCCGTGDLSLQLHRAGARLVSLDFSLAMLAKGRDRGWLRGGVICADAVRLPFKDSSFNLLTIAFGIRNIPDMDLFATEAFRVTMPGGLFIILELTRPRNPVVRMGYNLYLKFFLPVIGGMVSGRWTAYRYLARTIETFLDPADLAKWLRAAGFNEVDIVPRTSGIATVIVCRRAE